MKESSICIQDIIPDTGDTWCCFFNDASLVYVCANQRKLLSCSKWNIPTAFRRSVNQRASTEGWAKSCVLSSVLETVLQPSVRFSPSRVRSVCVEFLDTLSKILLCFSPGRVDNICFLLYKLAHLPCRFCYVYVRFIGIMFILRFLTIDKLVQQ
jgi:hypothetical protein